MFLNIRGTFGSGKTTVIGHIMEELKARGAVQEDMIEPIARLEGKKRFMGHRYTSLKGLSKGVIFMGKYGQSACGGADTLNWKGAHEDAEAFIKKHIADNHVLMEGSITSGGSRYNRIGCEFGNQGIGSLYLHMATPRDTCVERVLGRRKKRHADKIAKATLQGKALPEAKEFSRSNLDKLFDVVEKQWDKTVALGLVAKKIESEPDIGKYIVSLLERDEHVIRQPNPNNQNSGATV